MSAPVERHGATLRKLGLLGSLYFSQGLPFGFFTQALPIILRKQGLSLAEVGLSSLLAVPWALKFLWAPAVDRWSIPALGRRRSWILPLQLASFATLVALAFAPTDRSVTVLMGAVFLLNLLSATQDIATDGLAVDALQPRERGIANGLQVAGYRVGMVAGGGVLLIFHERLGWEGTFLTMALLLALASVPVIAMRERNTGDAPSSEQSPMPHFLRRPGAARLVLLVVFYKAGDAFATGMLRPFLADLGLSLADVGWLLGTVGFVAGLLGALAGGALVNRLGRKTSLIVFGLLQALSVAGYAYLALGRPGWTALYVASAVEHFTSGMATAALFTCMMDWCSPGSAATDYTVQASAVVIATGAASALSGFSAEALGYSAHFAVAAAFTLVSLALVFLWFPARAPAFTEAVNSFGSGTRDGE